MQDQDSGVRSLTPSASGETTAEAQAAAPPGSARKVANQPPGYPNAIVWLRTGVLRDWRGVVGSFIACWFYVPVALALAVVSAVTSGVFGLISGPAEIADLVPDVIRDVPLVGSLIEQFIGRSGGVLGGFVGFGLGLLAGLLLVLILPWQGTMESPVELPIGLAAVIATAILVGVVYTVFRVLCEPWLLKVSGARPLSRREAAQLLPVLHECARRLDLPSVPRLLVEDDPLTNAHTYARHIVVSTGVLSEPPEEIAALLSHELVHWRTGDEVTSAFVRGVGLPLVLMHAVPVWLMRTFPHPGTNFVVFVLFWPVLLTMKYLVMPLHSRDVRTAEYRADLGAVVAGHAEGMRALLEKRKSFESGRSGWEAAVCASHPPSELRLDRLRPADPADDTTTTDSTDPEPGTTMVAAPSPPTAAALFAPSPAFGSRRTWLAIGVVLLLLCLPAVPLGVVQWAIFRPQAAVAGYFSALAERDSAAAAEWLGSESSDAVTGDRMLTELIRSDAYQPPTDVEIDSLDRHGDDATAELSFTLGDAQMTGTMRLRRNESTSLGLFHGWHIVDGVGELALAGDQPGLQVNGVAVPTSSEGGTVLTVLPGVYTATVPQSVLSQTPPVSVVVTPGLTEPVNVAVVPQLDPTARDLANQAVKKYLDGCVAQRVPEPTGCPFALYNSDARNVVWKIDNYPAVEVELVHAGLARVTTVSSQWGRVTVTWRGSDYFGGTQSYTDDQTFDVDGTLTVADESLLFHPDN